MSFRIRADAIPFYQRMIKYFYDDHLIQKPKLSHLAKACLNTISNRLVAYEEIGLARYVQKNLAAARGRGVFPRYGVRLQPRVSQ